MLYATDDGTLSTIYKVIVKKCLSYDFLYGHGVHYVATRRWSDADNSVRRIHSSTATSYSL